MDSNSYAVIYTIGNLFMAYVIYKFMGVFYTESKVNKATQILAYIAYFILITCTHVIIKIPLVVLISNIVLLFSLTLLYVGDIKKNLLSVVIIYTSLMCIETAVAILTGFLKTDLLHPYDYNSKFGIIAIRIASYVFVLIIQGFKNVKNEYPIPTIYWLSLFVVPFGTMTLLFTIFMKNTISSTFIVGSICIALLINVTTFYLYDCISKLIVDKMNQRLLEQQNKYYNHQLSMMKTALHHTKLLKHDLKNQLSPLYELALNDKREELLSQLSKLTDICSTSKEYSHSGNINIDSIINFKLQQAQKDNIEISTDIIVPHELSISPFDIAVILGNLIDNAIEGVKSINYNRWIDIRIKFTKGRLITKISNSFDGTVYYQDGTIISRKNDTENHGLGLNSIENAIQKYNGALHLDYDSCKFKVKVLMYI